MKVFYGAQEHFLDITDFFNNKKFIFVPKGDKERTTLFTDPIPYVTKYIKVIDNFNNILIFNQHTIVFLHKTDNITSPESKQRLLYRNLVESQLTVLHNYINFPHGSLLDEYPEQIMALMYIKPENKVLELGANIGRNTSIISKILNDSSNLVTLEPIKECVRYLESIKTLNNFNFHIENSCLSKKRMVQKNWESKPIDSLLLEETGWREIPTITWDNLQSKYNLTFDTLVLDCEGAIYYILQEEPNFLATFSTIIIENDFLVEGQKEFVDEQFRKFNLEVVYEEHGGWGLHEHFFYQVWQRKH